MNAETIPKKKVKCYGGCNYELVAPEAFPSGSYCSQYCCGCCPDAKNSPCQKEKKTGGFFDNLKKEEK